LRSHDAVTWRKYWRNVKKNMARRDRRRDRSRQAPLALRAQEPGAGSERTVCVPRRTAAGRVGPPRVRPGMKLRVASLNIQGMKVVMKREEVEAWMASKSVMVLALQETHIHTSGVEKRGRYTWYFSGPRGGVDGKEGRTYAGVAIVIKNEWRNYVRDIEPVDERHLVMRFWGRPQISIVAAYGPTAQANEEEKRKFWRELVRIVREEDARGVALVLGDLNARLQVAQEGEEDYVGRHTFDSCHTTLHLQSEEVLDNRARFVDMIVEMDHLAMNTMFEKEEKKKVTFKQDKGHAGGPPWKRGTYEMLDYVTTSRRWRNAVVNVETDVHANVDTDHFPLVVDLQVRLNAQEKRKQEERIRYLSCTGGAEGEV
jgi:exonuclease III